MDLAPTMFRAFSSIVIVGLLASGAYGECLAFTLGVLLVVLVNRRQFFARND